MCNRVFLFLLSKGLRVKSIFSFRKFSSLSQIERNILYVNTYMQNLEKWYRRLYLQSRNRGTDVENKHMDTNWGSGLMG